MEPQAVQKPSQQEQIQQNGGKDEKEEEIEDEDLINQENSG